MKNVKKSKIYEAWLANLKDREARLRIVAQTDRLAEGNCGKGKFLGGGVYELKINYGSGYRVYYTRIENVVCLLLCGGDKKTQQQDIILAKKLSKIAEVIL